MRRRAGDENVSSDEDTDDEKNLTVTSEQRLEYDAVVKSNEDKKFTYEKLIEGLKEGKFKKIVVLTGAGISVSAGIPDFRSPKTGLYSNLQKYKLPRPEDIFCIRYFNDHPEAFYQLADEFLDTSKFKPTLTHHFISLLDKKGLL